MVFLQMCQLVELEQNYFFKRKIPKVTFGSNDLMISMKAIDENYIVKEKQCTQNIMRDFLEVQEEDMTEDTR